MDIAFILILILFNGFFSMAEFAIISSRKSKLKNMAIGGNQRGKLALYLAEKPNIFLSSIQIGITLVTVLAGAVGQEKFATKIALFIKPMPFIGSFHTEIAFVVIVSSITYLSIVLGELVPKRIALSNPEKIASLVAPIMLAFSNVIAPIIRLLSFSTEFVFKLFGLKQGTPSHITEDEIRILIREGTDMGIFSKTEKKLIERALMLDDLRVGMLMTPKHKMAAVNIEKLKKITNKPHLVPESMKAIKVLEMFRHSPVHIALILDEFGNIQGLVTLNDILEALVGEIKSQTPQDFPIAVRDDGALFIDGTVPIYDLKKKLHLREL